MFSLCFNLRARIMKKIFTLLLSYLALSQVAISQEFTLDADIRPRFEYRHGFGSLFPDDAKPAAFVTQRSRLNMAFKDKKLSLYFSMHDVSMWGDEQTLTSTDNNNSVSLFHACIRYSF